LFPAFVLRHFLSHCCATSSRSLSDRELSAGEVPLDLAEFCHRLRTRNHYWNLKADFMVDITGRTMPRNRFDKILRFLHIANSQRLDPDDRMGKLRPMMDHLQDVFQKAYIPEQHLSFDESMVAYYGRHGCKQFIRGKPIRFGLKNVCLCMPLGYLIAFDTYQGKIYRCKGYDNFGKGGGCLLNITDSLQYDFNKLPTIFIVITVSQECRSLRSLVTVDKV